MRHSALKKSPPKEPARVVGISESTHGVYRATLLNLEGLKTVSARGTPPGLHDWVAWNPKTRALTVLTPNRTPARTRRFTDHVLDPRRLHATQIRRELEAGIRAFFDRADFLETRTPLLVPCPGMETHIRPVGVRLSGDREAFLPTSPEFAMKRLLAGGLPRIYQLSQAFRDEPRSRTHFAEFTMLEWYRSNSGYEQIQKDAEGLIESLARKLLGGPALHFDGRRISVKRPWPRLTVRSLFKKHLGLELAGASSEVLAQKVKSLGLPVSSADTWDDLYFKLWLNAVEPKLPANQAVFVTRYPESQAALAVVDEDPDGSRWAKRFEIYIGGIELANAFEELTDPEEQRARFVADMEARKRAYGSDFPPNPIDEDFLQALTEGMPPSGGIALGVDRLVMLLADEQDIQYTQWLAPFDGTP